MSAPEEIKNDNDLIRELMNVTSSLNTYCDDGQKLEDLKGKYLSETYFGAHAMEHLNNCFNYLIKKQRNLS